MKNNKKKKDEEIDWDVNTELILLHCMVGPKPLGVFRNFVMACIHQKFTSILNRKISSQVIWDHLDTMYNMEVLHEMHKMRFKSEEREFALSVREFGNLMIKKMLIHTPKLFHEANESSPELSMLIKPVSVIIHRFTPGEIKKLEDPDKCGKYRVVDCSSTVPLKPKNKKKKPHFYPRVVLEKNLDLVLERTCTHLSPKDKKLLKLNELKRKNADVAKIKKNRYARLLKL